MGNRPQYQPMLMQPTTLAEARLGQTSDRIAMMVLTSVDDGGWEDDHVRCPVDRIRCSELVLKEYVDQLAGVFLSKLPTWVDTGSGCLRLSCMICPAETRFSDDKYGRIIEGIYFGSTFQGIGLAAPTADVLAGDDSDLFRAIVDTAKANDGLFGLFEHLITYGPHEFLERLLAANVCPDPSSDYGLTPLFIACRSGNPSLVRRLLAHGADPAARTVDGLNPLQFTLTLLPFDETDRKRDRDAEIIRILADAGAAPELEALWQGLEHEHRQLGRDFGPLPPDMWMARSRDEMIQVLQEAGVLPSLDADSSHPN